MKRHIAVLLACSLVSAAIAQDAGKPEKQDGKQPTAKKAEGVLQFTMKNIDGKAVPLAEYDGKVVLMVNVASKCGLTRQYEQLQGLHEKYATRGLKILGFPANNFGGQEPGSEKEIKEFCTGKYDVKFDMFSKVSVKGDDCCDLYGYLTGKDSNKQFGGEIKWNFTKFLIDRQGKVIARFEPRTRPDDAEVVKAIEKALGEDG